MISRSCVAIDVNPYLHDGWRLFLPGMTTRIAWFLEAGVPSATTNSLLGSIFVRIRSCLSKGVCIFSPTMGTMPG